MLFLAHILTVLAIAAFVSAIIIYYQRDNHGGKITEMLGVIGFVLLLASDVIRLSLVPIP